MQPIDYLLIGHITADLTPEGRMLGGTVSYAVRTAHAFGLRVGVLTSAATDEPLLDQLSPYAQIVCVDAEATSTFENLYTAEGRVQYIRGVAKSLMPAQLPAEWRETPLIHLAPLTDEVDAAFAIDAPPQSTVMVTLQGWLRRWGSDGRVYFKPWFNADALRRLDAVVFSVEDIVEAPDMETTLSKAGQHVFVTQAEAGGIHYYNGEAYRYTTPQVEVVHPTGAGDVFAASLLCAYQKLGDWNAAAQVAAMLAAKSVTRLGLDSAPTVDEVKEALDSVAK